MGYQRQKIENLMYQDTKVDSSAFCFVYNIPSHFHSRHLRRFFQDAVTSESPKIVKFHFKHRPLDFSKFGQYCVDGIPNVFVTRPLNCCPIVLTSEDVYAEFRKKYGDTFWTELDEDGRDEVELDDICKITKLKSTFKQIIDFKMSEMKPSEYMMPKGNVGTPLTFYVDAIKRCRMPSSFIKKLELDFSINLSIFAPPPESALSKKRGSKTAIEFMKEGSNQNHRNNKWGDASWRRRQKLLESRNRQGPKVTTHRQIQDHVSLHKDDNDTEEWDRHMSTCVVDNVVVPANRVISTYKGQMVGLENLAQFQQSTKQKAFEDDMEVTWEKGGSGLVFHTDVNYWKEIDSHHPFEETCSWDVNYNNESSSSHTLRLQTVPPSDLHDTCTRSFRKVKHSPRRSLKNTKSRQVENNDNPEFSGERNESTTFMSSFAVEQMRKMGWQKGEGLGASRQGIVEALKCEGQSGSQRLGIGYSRPTKSEQRRISCGDKLVSRQRRKEGESIVSSQSTHYTSTKFRDNKQDEMDGFVVIPTIFDKHPS